MQMLERELNARSGERRYWMLKVDMAGRKYGDDHVLRCLPAGLPRIFGSPYPMQIVDAGSHYLMVFMQDNTPRRVWEALRDAKN